MHAAEKDRREVPRPLHRLSSVIMRRIALLLLPALLFACNKEQVSTNVRHTGAPVILISIDTLRADHLPAYGYKQGRTPHLDAFRKDATLYSNAWSNVPLTLPSHTSILSGLLPPHHGVHDNVGFKFDGAQHPTIASLLKEQGYATGAAVSSYVLRGDTGLRNGFDFYDDEFGGDPSAPLASVYRPGDRTAQIAEQWIGERSASPFFFFFHIYEPHAPYEPAPEFRDLPSAYDGEVATADAIVGRLIDSLKRAKVYDRALIIVLSDHGEGLGDHGEDQHGIFLYRESLHVPLLVKLPQNKHAGERVDSPVSLTDVMPTILGVTGAKTPSQLDGRSLFATAKPRRIYSETFYPRIHLGWSELRSMIDDRFHFIDAPREELYALDDIAEERNILSENRREAASMRKELEPFPRELPKLSNIDPEEAKKLAALGYLTSTPQQGSGPLPDPKDRVGDLHMTDEVLALEASGKIDEAIARVREVLARNPSFVDAFALLGRLLERRGDLQGAATAYESAIRIEPALAKELALSLASVYLMLDRYDDAVAHARLGMSANPALAHLILGRAALDRGDLQTAQSEAQAAMAAPTQRSAALVLSAQVLGKQRRFDEALAVLDRAATAAKEDGVRPPAQLHFVRGDVFARMNRAEEAMREFNEEIRLYPNESQAYANLAVVQILTGDLGAAESTMQRLVRANPGPTSYELAAQTFDRMRQPRLAAKWRQRG